MAAVKLSKRLFTESDHGGRVNSSGCPRWVKRVGFVMSAVRPVYPTTDISGPGRHFAFGPNADIRNGSATATRAMLKVSGTIFALGSLSPVQRCRIDSRRLDSADQHQGDCREGDDE